jgi:putative ABC transport system ATP-binding protein
LRLSGGEQQRVAIARALSYDPKIVLADEPTGNLDGETQDEIMQIFKDLAHKEEKCVIIVSHSPDVAKQADEVFELS